MSERKINLNLAIAINENLKKVIEISNQINIVAMNAILIAKRAGQQSSGFRVVAMELRLFSQKIEEIMSFLGKLIFSLVYRIAELRKQERNLHLLSIAMSKNPESLQSMDMSFQKKKNGYDEKHLQASADWHKLETEIIRSLALCSSGAMLSHNARIEAAYGGSMLADMQQVANRIEEIMYQTIFSLKQLNATLKAPL